MPYLQDSVCILASQIGPEAMRFGLGTWACSLGLQDGVHIPAHGVCVPDRWCMNTCNMVYANLQDGVCIPARCCMHTCKMVYIYMPDSVCICARQCMHTCTTLYMNLQNSVHISARQCICTSNTVYMYLQDSLGLEPGDLAYGLEPCNLGLELAAMTWNLGQEILPRAWTCVQEFGNGACI